MLETMRLVVPNGRAIPATIAEVNRFRAAAGFPDNHTGVTIEQTIPAAKRLYGLSDNDYYLTRDFGVLARELESPSAACVVTGLMSAVPPALRKWDRAFTGAHAVAKHGVRVWCDPLAPQDGVYKGETVALSTWRSYATTLPGWQACIMEIRVSIMGVLSMGGINVTSDKRARVLRTTDLLASPGGARIASAQPGYEYPLIGADSGYRMVKVRTALPYSDKIPRDTGLYIKATDITVV
jgi:hypothetical protein